MQWRSLFLKMVDMLFFPGLWCHNYINHKEFGLPSGFLCGWSSSHLFSEDPVQAVLQTLRTRKLVSRFVSWSGWYSWYTDFRRASAWGPTEFSSEQLFNEPLGCQCGVLHTAYTAGCSPNTKCFFNVFSCFPRFSTSFSDPLKAFGCVFPFKCQKSQLAKVREAILQRRAWHPENGHLWPTLARCFGFVSEADAPERSKHIFLVFRYVQL